MTRKRIRFSGLRWLWLFPLSVLALVLVRIVAADWQATRDPVLALEWWPWHSAVLQRGSKAATQRLPDQAARSELLGRTMLGISPLAGGGYAALAAVADKRGETGAAESLYRIAARRSPRDRTPHFWLANHASMRGDFELAAHHFDQILRLSPSRLSALMPTIESIAAHPDGRSALTRLLGEQAPPWRATLLRRLALRSEDLMMVFDLFDALRRATVPLTSGESQTLVQRLIREGYVPQAYLLWANSLPAERRESLGNLFDGGFELPWENGAFGWRIGRVPGASIRRDGGRGVGGQRALAIEFQHRYVRFGHVQQTLALPAGDYRFFGRARLDDLRTERGLRWILRCASGAAIGETEAFSGRRDWRDFELEFSVPKKNCAAQQLVLTLAARVKAEQWIGGRVWFDDLGIRRR